MYGYPLILLPDVCELPVKRQRKTVGWRLRAPLAGAAGAQAGRTWAAAVQRRSPAGDGGGA